MAISGMEIHPIDLRFQGKPHLIASYLIASDDDLALIETGPSTCLSALDQGIREAGFDPFAIRKVLVTHIHLDHAGAAGHWAARGAQIFVHERGARHLMDPERLIEGARAVYGDAMETLWGQILPVAESRLSILREGDAFTVGRVRFVVWDAPGHARHHLVLSGAGSVFSGDNAGVRLPGSTFLSPASAPSQFDPDALLVTLERIAAVGFNRLCLTHFGIIEGPEAVKEHLERYRSVISDLKNLALSSLPNAGAPAEWIARFRAGCLERARSEGVDATTWELYEAANDSAMCAEGVRQWWENFIKRPGTATG
ncbi:MAG: Glyoxylase, beta-lactamase superfamily II [Verrucomicrobia bacterium]|jgi:glyoxylase-like metal-dependent hydrolase (beta-lactamase superfamily II)|nr:MAG: Glyoxylase, beta-lactamase superfamily II [Verrucomicrobiota bacterium]